MFWLWLIVAVLFFAVGVYVLGRIDWDGEEKIGLFWAIFIGSLLWPLVLAVAIVIGPFSGIYWLGDRARKAKKAAKDK